MRMTFMHKVILTILAGFLAACLIESYKWLDREADEVSTGIYERTEIDAPRR